ncbi:hypothetical protein ACHAWF_008066 [Thalassiosira exigua]
MSAIAVPPFATPAPGTAAYYDPHARCIKLVDVGDVDGEDGGEDGWCALACTLVDPSSIDDVPFLIPGKVLAGEVIEVVDPYVDEDDDEDDDDEGGGDAGGILTRSFLEKVRGPLRDDDESDDDEDEDGGANGPRELLLTKQRELQHCHAVQCQDLLRKQARDWAWFREKDLGESRRVQLEDLHRSEAMELQTKQQKEQGELTEAAFDCLLFAERGRTRERAARGGGGEGGRNDAPRNDAPTTEDAGTQTDVQERPPLAPSRSPARHRGSSRDAGTAASLTDRISVDRKKADEMKAVMRDRSLSREERQRKLAEIKERYASGGGGGGAGSGGGGERGGGSDSLEDKKKKELREIMKDRSLEREERLEKMKEVKAKYAALAAAGDNGDAKDAKRVDDAEAAEKASGEKPSEEKAAEEKAAAKERAASRWNRAAVKAVAGNLVAKSMSKEEGDGDDDADGAKDDGEEADDDPQDKEEEAAEDEPAEEKGAAKARAASRWNRAAVKVVTGNLVAAAQASASDPNRESGKSTKTDATDDTDDMVFGGGASAAAPTAPAPAPSAEEALAAKLAKKSGGDEGRKKGGGGDPFEDVSTDRTPIKKLMKRLKEDDGELVVLKLDGRKKIKEEDWESFFETLEENSTLKHLSLARCDLTDAMAVALVLSLVENETLVSIRLNNNRGLTDDTAKGFAKVLNQSNKTLKKLDLSRTKVSKPSMQKINEVLEERDDHKKSAKLQEERQKKIQALLSFSAGDKVAEENAALSAEKDGTSEAVEEGLDQSHRSSGLISVGSGTSSRKTAKTTSVASSRRRMDNRRATVGEAGREGKVAAPPSKLGGSAGAAKLGGSGTAKLGTSGTRGPPPTRRAGNRRGAANPSMRASMTAQQMAQLGGDLANVGADAAKLKEQRKTRGECETCGQKCYTKTMFKTTPLTIPNAVLEGRCLKCNPM